MKRENQLQRISIGGAVALKWFVEKRTIYGRTSGSELAHGRN
jgi:hypothetical protein